MCSECAIVSNRNITTFSEKFEMCLYSVKLLTLILKITCIIPLQIFKKIVIIARNHDNFANY